MIDSAAGRAAGCPAPAAPTVATMSSLSWTPILDGALAERAREAVEAIARDPRMRSAGAADPAGLAPVSLAAGSAGRALFYAYYADCGADDAAETAVALLEHAFAAMPRLPVSLYEGFTGVAWVHAHLDGWLFQADDEDPLAAVDAAVIDFLQLDDERGEYDLISGLVGLGVYALERPDGPRRHAMIDRTVARLAAGAEREGSEAAWFTPPARLHPVQLAQAPNGVYDVGMAHGIPGVVAWLARSCHDGGDAGAPALLTEATSWLRRQELGADSVSAYPYWRESGQAPRPARLAWCYGDPGVACALVSAARGASRDDWEADGLRTGLKAAARPMATSGVIDAGLCHGAAGVAHIFNRLYQATGDSRLADASRRWLTHALDLRRPGDGVAGFVAGGDGIDDRGFLTGAAGVGLALIAACTDIEPAWDRVLLLDVPHVTA
jgi:lantibiotic modifying enzyme